MRQRQGFTLVEVLITAVVLGAMVSIAMLGYTEQRRRAEHRAAVATMRALSSAVRNYRYSLQTTPTTTTTAATSALYSIPLQDDRFFGYSVTPNGTTYTMRVQYRSAPSGASSAIYTFDANGTQTGCSGSPCLSI